MIAVIFATYREARPFLNKAGLNTSEDCGQIIFDLRPGKQIVACICGMGPQEASRNTRRLLCEYDISSVINAGISGALIEEQKTGDIFRITATLAWPSDPQVYHHSATRFRDLPSAALATVEQPVFDSALRKEMAAVADLVDMEGAYIALACIEKNIPYHAIKGVSDFAGDGDRKTLYANIDKVSATIAETLWKEL